MKARLIGRTGGTTGKDIDLDKTMAIGAASGNDVRLRQPGVSKVHARFVVDGEVVTIEDAGSTNGTFVNGHRIEKHRLQHLDVVTLGRSLDFIFLHREDSAAPELVPYVLSATLEPAWGEGEAVEVTKGEFTVGRAPICNLIIDEATVSKMHARLTRTRDHVTLEDLESKNGTTVNGTRIDAPVTLKSRDRVGFGESRPFVLRITTSRAAAPEPSGPISIGTSFTSIDQTWKTRAEWTPDEWAELVGARPARMPGNPLPPMAPAQAPELPLARRSMAPPPVPPPEPPPSSRGPATPVTAIVDVSPSAGFGSPLTGVRLKNESHPFEVGLGTFVIGRSADSAIHLDHGEVSRQHAVLNVLPASAKIENRSQNGTLVNRRKIVGPYHLKTGDRITIGTFEFVVELLR